METIAQFKKRSRNEIETIRDTFGLRKRELAERSGVTDVTIGKIFTRCQDVKAETIEQVLFAARDIKSERMEAAR